MWDRDHQKIKFSRSADAYQSQGRQLGQLDDREEDDCHDRRRMILGWRDKDQNCPFFTQKQKKLGKGRFGSWDARVNSATYTLVAMMIGCTKGILYITDEDGYGRHRDRQEDDAHREAQIESVY